MDFVNKIVCGFTTKHPDQRTVRKSWPKVSLRRFSRSNDINWRILAKARKRLLSVLHSFQYVYERRASICFRLDAARTSRI